MKLADNASLGIIETKGLVGAVAAADAMAKAAPVSIFRKHYPGSARVTLMCQGELSACEAAVYAGTREAETVGELIGHTVIGRPDFGAEDLCLGCIDEAMERKRQRKARVREKAFATTSDNAPRNEIEDEPGDGTYGSSDEKRTGRTKEEPVTANQRRIDRETTHSSAPEADAADPDAPIRGDGETSGAGETALSLAESESESSGFAQEPAGSRPDVKAKGHGRGKKGKG